jgi:hypothetical protein
VKANPERIGGSHASVNLDEDLTVTSTEDGYGPGPRGAWGRRPSNGGRS